MSEKEITDPNLIMATLINKTTEQQETIAKLISKLALAVQATNKTMEIMAERILILEEQVKKLQDEKLIDSLPVVPGNN